MVASAHAVSGGVCRDGQWLLVVGAAKDVLQRPCLKEGISEPVCSLTCRQEWLVFLLPFERCCCRAVTYDVRFQHPPLYAQNKQPQTLAPSQPQQQILKVEVIDNFVCSVGTLKLGSSH